MPAVNRLRSWLMNAPTTRAGFAAAALLAGAFAAAYAGCTLLGPKPPPSFEGLLRGDGQIRLTAMVISEHGRRVEWTDDESLRYLTRAFRSAERVSYDPTRRLATHLAFVELDESERVLVALCVPEDNSGLFLSSPVFVTEEEIAAGYDVVQPRYYLVRLPHPIPPTISAGIAQLRGQRLPHAATGGPG